MWFMLRLWPQRPIRVLVRARRAYAAGLGTAGSLLAGAAALFLLVAALVGFHGWPTAQTGVSPIHIVVARHPPAGSPAGTPAGARLPALLAGPPAGTPAAGGAPRRRGAATRSPGGPGRGVRPS